ncbi:caspase family protein [Pigmentiphaga litoralis]|uniref:caspase family protein n=1 Tax=Pigmentiphaga litoralis TaxID=516702 RepID=UPI003B429A1F
MDEDYAILVGISWYPAGNFAELSGPLNDVALVEKWLGESGLLPCNIIKITTPREIPADFDKYAAPPIADDFDHVFRAMLDRRMAMPDRVKGRLYLYFSGHGFSSKTQDRDAEGALYCANATRIAYEHIFGTHYARIAKAWALFAQVVLIMDCCRDSEFIRTPTPRPYRDTPDDALSADVPLLSIYAAPKSGKAQERPIEERGNKVHGLLTHALFKLLEELPASSQRGIDATELKARLLESWTEISGSNAAPRPEIYLPANGTIYFSTKNKGSAVTFVWAENAAPSNLQLIDSGAKIIGVFALDDSGTFSTTQNGPVLSYTREANAWTLRLTPGLYEYKHSDKEAISFRVAGGNRRVEL